MTILDASRTIFVSTVLLALLGQGCDDPVLDEGSARARGMQPNQNQYFDSKFPEYQPIIYRVSGFRREEETRYFEDSLRQARDLFKSSYPDERVPFRYLVIMITSTDEHTSAADYVHTYKSARVFSFRDVFDSGQHFGALVARTPAEELPIVADPADENGPRYGEGGPVIARHVEMRKRNGEAEGSGFGATTEMRNGGNAKNGAQRSTSKQNRTRILRERHRGRMAGATAGKGTTGTFLFIN